MLKKLAKYWQRIKSVLGLYRVGIYITEEALYFIEVDRDIFSYKVKNIDVEWFLPSEKLSEPVSRLVARYPHITDYPVYANVAEKSTISEFISLPKMSKEELAKGIPLEVARHLPYNAQTMEFAYQVLGETKGNYTVLAVIAKHSQIKEIWEGFEQAQLRLKKLSISNYSFINALKSPQNKTTGYLYPEPQSCTINLFDEGLLIFSYTSYAKNLVSQLKDIDHALAQFSRNKDISKRLPTLRFIGDFSSFPESEKTRFMKYFIGIEQEDEYVFPSKSVEKFFVELPAMVGLVLNRAIKINLLPKKMQEDTNRFITKRRLWFAVVLFHVALFLLGAKSFVNYSIMDLEDDILLSTAPIHQNNSMKWKPGSLVALTNKNMIPQKSNNTKNKKSLYKKQIKYVDDLLKKIELYQRAVELYKTADKGRSDISYFLYYLASVMPKDVRLQKVKVSVDKNYTIDGWAKNQKSFRKFVEKMGNMGKDSSVTVSLLKERKGQLYFILQGSWVWQK